MRRMARRPAPKEFEILDVTSEVVADYHVPSPSFGSDEDEVIEQAGPRSGELYMDAYLLKSESLTPAAAARVAQSPGKARPSRILQKHQRSSIDNASPTSQRQTESAVANLLYLSQSGHPPRPTPSLTPQPQPQPQPQTRPVDIDPALKQAADPMCVDMVHEYSYMEQMQAFTPEGSSEDGIFLPGSAYHELHSTLRNHLIQETMSDVPTRATTPRYAESSRQPSTVEEEIEEAPSAPDYQTAPTVTSPPLLTEAEECALWKNYFDEIAPWLDKFDRDRHFQHILPTMTKNHDYLRYSMLALSARQLELKETTPTDRSLALYQEAIHQLLPDLPTRGTAVIATCVILCVLEMLSCSPKAWRRHLDGCAGLMGAVGINGFVGGVEQALFWCFARMDVCGGLISSVKTLIPAGRWASKRGLDADVEMFKATTEGFEQWANYAVYLVAQVLDLLAPLPSETLQAPARNEPKFRARWMKLWKVICDWHHRRPAPLLPTMTMASSATSPFPTILFSNPAAISGNQLHHTASILMLQNQPPNVRLAAKPRSILWHARQVCGISISNDHHGAWTNGIQPLWIAGRCMSHPSEHRAILELLGRIERESGWGTRWRAEDLTEFWGDLGE